MHSEVLRKIVSEHLSRVKNSKDSMKFIYMMKNASLWVLSIGKVQDNKALHKRHIKDYNESIKMKLYQSYIIMMKNLTLKTELQNGV